MNDKVLVTGGSGFVASHLIDQLLTAGAQVNTSVRSLGNGAKLAPLRNLERQFPGKLQLFEADLLKPESFDAAMRGCRVVYHVASPFMLPEKIKDGQREMLEPALKGTQNVLGSVNRTESVQRVVLTSTVGAIFGDYVDVLQMKDHTLSEAYFNSSSSVSHNPYHYSKVMAEQEAWRIQRAQGRWSMVAINPGLILGPSITPSSDSGSLSLLDEMLKGNFFYGMPDMSVTVVDVREVALAHIRAAQNPNAQGRYILAHADMISFLQMAECLREAHHRPFLLPSRQIPGWFVKLIFHLFGLSQQYMRNHIGIRFKVDNHRSREELGIRYRPIEETLRDHYSSWLSLRRRAAA